MALAVLAAKEAPARADFQELRSRGLAPAPFLIRNGYYPLPAPFIWVSSGVQRHPDAGTFPGLLIWRVGGDLFFASIGRSIEALKNALTTCRPQPTHVLVDAASINFLDTTACDELLAFIRELHSQGITIGFARVRDHVRERMRLGGIEALVSSSNFYERVTDGVRACLRDEGQDRLLAGKS